MLNTLINYKYFGFTITVINENIWTDRWADVMKLTDAFQDIEDRPKKHAEQ
jgi:hypothetical protein